MMILRVAAVCIWQSPRRLLGATCHSDIAYEHSINTLEQLICLSFVSMPRLHETYCISIQVRGTKNHRKPFENCRKSRWCVAIESRSTCLPIPTILVQTSTDANASWIGRVDLHPKKDPSQTETFASSEPFFTLHFKHAYPHLNTTAIESFCHSETGAASTTSHPYRPTGSTTHRISTGCYPSGRGVPVPAEGLFLEQRQDGHEKGPSVSRPLNAI
jgi:hypothetical protein